MCFTSPPDKGISACFLYSSQFCAHADIFDPSGWIYRMWDWEEVFLQPVGWQKFCEERDHLGHHDFILEVFLRN